ncbi:MAG: CBS domain-containing protein [Planctomycetes bacterium]|nr:CBS domain-containing protein [Planctomycetota bacterium]
MASATLTGILVHDVMTARPVAVSPTMTIRELAELLDANEISGVPVVDGQDRVIGVVSKTDLLHQWIRGSEVSDGGDYSGAGSFASSGSFIELLEDGIRANEIDRNTDKTIEEFMSVEPVTAHPDESLDVISRRMVNERVHRVIVVDQDSRLVGIVTTLDILDHISDSPKRVSQGKP